MAKKLEIPEVVLNSGQKMPLIGMGTAASPLPSPPQLTSILLYAIEIGYRHFDTAAFYGSEESVGLAVAAALERGLVNSRSDLFITSKLWCTHADHDLVLPAIQIALQKMGLEYLDLYLIHWPVRLKQEAAGINFTKEDILPFDIKATWEAMEKCHKLGLAKSIGLSNFGTKKISQLLQHATIRPAVNQVEMNPVWQQGNLREFCKEKGIHVSAWSPLGANGAIWGSHAVMQNPVLKEIAAAKGKSLAQVALRWIIEQGACVIVKSFNEERMKENSQIFDWELSEDETALIKTITQHRGCSGEFFVNENGPYKSLCELWDEEP